LAVDSSGNVYIADTENNVIRKVTSSGIGSIFAGNGTAGYSGDGGPATSASLRRPSGVAIDSLGNVFIADTANNCIRKVSTSGIITDAGMGVPGYSGDGGLALSAQMYLPYGVTADSAGNLYIADMENSVVRAVGAGPATPLVTWNPPLSITAGTALSSAQLNATAAVAGSYVYSPAAGAILSVGQQYLNLTFTPNDTADFNPVYLTSPITVQALDPVIAWATPAAVPAGTLLSSTQLNATASSGGSSVPGSFVYSPSLGTKLTAGAHVLSVIFTPADITKYDVASGSVSINVTTGTQQDSGTVTLSVDSGSGFATVATASYAAGSTTGSVAQDLAASAATQSTPVVSVSALNDQLTIVSTATATSTNATNYPYKIVGTTSQPANFSQASFVSSAITGNLDGGQVASVPGTSQTIYSFSVPSSGGYDASGNLLSYTDTVMGSWTFTYDTLDRLVTGAAGSGSSYNGQHLCWAYDAFGNRTMQTMQSGACTSGMTPTESFDLNNQSASGLDSYDDAGDVVADPRNEYLYDAEGRICAVAGSVNGVVTMTGYLYDAGGTRVSKGTIRYWSCDPTTSQYSTTNDYILGPGGEQFSEYVMQPGGTMAWQHTNVWAAGRLLATYSQDSITKNGTTTTNALLHFYFDDPLGTRRAQTDYAGNLEQTCSSLPYGDGETCASSPTEHLFTGKERDAESGNDYFGARYYASTMGRFMSPDWSAKEEPVPYAKLDDPQTLNLYAYVGNSPMTRFDLDGHSGVADGMAMAAQNAAPLDPSLWDKKQPPPPAPAQQQSVAAQCPGCGDMNSAAVAAEKAALPLTQASVDAKNYHEYGGYILESKSNPDQFTYSKPLAGTEKQVDIDNIRAPKGYKVVGEYHTHPRGPGDNLEGFSTRDGNRYNANGRVGYVADNNTRRMYVFVPGVTVNHPEWERTGDFVQKIP
jgi:RHS repeat-associated protein